MMFLLVIPSIWLAAATLTVAACRMAARGDAGRSSMPGPGRSSMPGQLQKASPAAQPIARCDGQAVCSGSARSAVLSPP